MDCEQAHQRLYHYMDGELTVWRRWAITRHLDDCPPCSETFTFEVEVRRIVSCKCRDEVPPDLKARIARELGLDAST